jgi:hypothetical protein
VPPNADSAADGRAQTTSNVPGRYLADGNISVSSAADGGSLYKLTWQMYPSIFALGPYGIGQGVELDTPAGFQSYGANFNLDVYPFGKDAADDWGGVLASGGRINTIPKWIIRNGINNEKQNEKTTFNPTAANPWNSTKNGNGAINFHRTMIMEYVAYYEPGKGVLNSWDKNNNTVTVSFQTIRDTTLESNNSTLTTDHFFTIPLAVYYAITPMIENTPGAWAFPPAPKFDDYVLYEGDDFITTVDKSNLPYYLVDRFDDTNPCMISNKHTRTYKFNTDRFLNEEDEDEDAAICVWLIYFMNGALLNVPYAIASNGTTMYAGDVSQPRENKSPIYDYYDD